MNTKHTIAVIGATGNMGTAISKSLARGNNRLLLFGREKANVESLVTEITSAAASAEAESLSCITDASWEADVIILAVPYGAEREIAEKIGEVANQKIV